MSFWLTILVFSVLGSGFFAGSETAIISSNRLRQRAAREEGHRLAGLAERLYQRPERTLSVLLLGNNLVNVLASISAVVLTEKLLGGLGDRIPQPGMDLISTLWVAALILVVGEVLPKGVGFLYADRITRAVAPLLIPLNAVLGPPLLLIEKLSRSLARLGSSAPLPGEDSPSWETVEMHLETGREAGAVDADEEALIRRIALLSRLSARSLMIPLDQLLLHPVDGKMADLRGQLNAPTPLRCFLYEGQRRRIVGFLRTLNLLGLPETTPLRGLMRPVQTVPATRTLLDLIDELQFTRSKFAVVTGLENDALGVVFLRDLLGQLIQVRPMNGHLDNPGSLS